MILRPAQIGDEHDWLALWQKYCEFYQVTIPEQVTSENWRRILDPAHQINAVLAEDAASGSVVGFANYVTHFWTWSVRPAGYLIDLYVAEHNRRSGIGTLLIKELQQIGRQEGWARLYWMTKHDNAQARAVYDKLAQTDDFVRYCVQF